MNDRYMSGVCCQCERVLFQHYIYIVTTIYNLCISNKYENHSNEPFENKK